MVEFKIATAENLEKCVEIRLEMLKIVNNLRIDYKFSEDFIRETREYFASGDQTTVLAFDNGGQNAIGCATLSYIHIMPTFDHPTGNRAHLMNVYTNPDYRRQGIGAKMVSILVDDAKKRGATEIGLDATEMGKPLYAKLGFTQNESGMVLEMRNLK